MTNSLTVVAKIFSNTLQFLLQKMSIYLPYFKIEILTSHWLTSSLSFEQQGPVVQSVISLTSSLRIISLTVLADSIYNILIFFAEKM